MSLIKYIWLDCDEQPSTHPPLLILSHHLHFIRRLKCFPSGSGGSQMRLGDQKCFIAKKNCLENWNQHIKAWQGAINIHIKHLYVSVHGYSGPLCIMWLTSELLLFWKKSIKTSVPYSMFHSGSHILLLTSLLLHLWPLIKTPTKVLATNHGQKKAFSQWCHCWNFSAWRCHLSSVLLTSSNYIDGSHFRIIQDDYARICLP